jgi:hypothetical protein
VGDLLDDAGRELVSQAVRKMIDLGCEEVMLETEVSGTPAPSNPTHMHA